jgi:hypothetical protein
MITEFNLSEKEVETFDKSDCALYKGCYSREDVKEFIRLLKEDCNKNDGYTDIDTINKLAGERLIEEKK